MLSAKKEKKEMVFIHQSPLREKDIEQLSEDKREMLTELENLFTYYASKFDRHCYHELSQKAFNEIITKLLKKTKPSPRRPGSSPQQQQQPSPEERSSR
jgi:hypothetical protein